MGHSRLLARDTKEEEKGEEDVAVLGLEGGKDGGDAEVVEQVARANCWCPVAHPPPRRRSLVPGPRGSGKGTVSVLDPMLLRSFPATPFPKSLGGGMIGAIFACHLTAKISVKHLMKVLTQFKFLTHSRAF